MTMPASDRSRQVLIRARTDDAVKAINDLVLLFMALDVGVPRSVYQADWAINSYQDTLTEEGTP